MPQLPRLRQAVLAVRDLDAVAGQLRTTLGLGEPYADPGVEHFGLRNAVFALGDTFLEVVSPIRADTSAGRLLERRGGDCGYMLMFQIADLAAARGRARRGGVSGPAAKACARCLRSRSTTSTRFISIRPTSGPRSCR